MKNLIIILIVFSVFTGCVFTTKNHDSKEISSEKESQGQSEQFDNTPRVTGIGGIFFFSDDPAATREWYGENFGMAIDNYGSPFEFRNANNPDEINYLSWSPCRTGSEYFAPSKREFMINYRVNNIEGLVNKLRENGVLILDSITGYEYGKFVHLMDPDGNKIELWEPIDSFFTQMGGKTTK